MINGRQIAFKSISLVAILFGLLTIKAGGTVLFTAGEAHQAAGDYVPFVLWFNFLTGFFYIATGILLWWQHNAAALIAAIIALSTLLVFIAFGIHILSGGAYETRTIGAMGMRSTISIGIALISYLICRDHVIEERVRLGADNSRRASSDEDIG